MARLTKEQEIMVGIGVVAILGYFALRAPAEVSAVIDIPPEEGDTGMQLWDLGKKKSDPAQAFIDANRAQLERQQEMRRIRLERFMLEFDNYVGRLEQLWAALNRRFARWGPEQWLPLPDGLLTEVEKMLELNKAVLLSWKNIYTGVRVGLRLRPEQERMVVDAYNKMESHDMYTLERITEADHQTRLNMAAQQMVTYTHYTTNVTVNRPDLDTPMRGEKDPRPDILAHLTGDKPGVFFRTGKDGKDDPGGFGKDIFAHLTGRKPAVWDGRGRGPGEGVGTNFPDGDEKADVGQGFNTNVNKPEKRRCVNQSGERVRRCIERRVHGGRKQRDK